MDFYDVLSLIEKIGIPLVVAGAGIFLTPRARKWLGEKTTAEQRKGLDRVARGVFWAVERLARLSETNVDDEAVKEARELWSDLLKVEGGKATVNKKGLALKLLERELGHVPNNGELGAASALWEELAERKKQGLPLGSVQLDGPGLE